MFEIVDDKIDQACFAFPEVGSFTLALTPVDYFIEVQDEVVKCDVAHGFVHHVPQGPPDPPGGFLTSLISCMHRSNVMSSN